MINGVGLLERAIGYALGSLHLVTPQDLTHRTPCREWNLRDLLEHLADSLSALREAADDGTVGLRIPEPEHAGCPVAAVRDSASRLLGAWTNSGGTGLVTIGGSALAADVVTCTGAVELTVHGWDVAMACGRHRPIPAPLAEQLLALCPLVVTDADRPARFAAPVGVAPQAPSGERLVAFLGRIPRTRCTPRSR
jgi:uncharacterized protein (TIGR03086 family)